MKTSNIVRIEFEKTLLRLAINQCYEALYHGVAPARKADNAIDLYFAKQLWDELTPSGSRTKYLNDIVIKIGELAKLKVTAEFFESDKIEHLEHRINFNSIYVNLINYFDDASSDFQLVQSASSNLDKKLVSHEKVGLVSRR